MPPSAGQLIDSAGLKGFAIGSAAVSSKHANFLVCKERTSTSSQDMRELISFVKDKIERETGYLLEQEVMYIAYKE